VGLWGRQGKRNNHNNGNVGVEILVKSLDRGGRPNNKPAADVLVRHGKCTDHSNGNASAEPLWDVPAFRRAHLAKKPDEGRPGCLNNATKSPPRGDQSTDTPVGDGVDYAGKTNGHNSGNIGPLLPRNERVCADRDCRSAASEILAAAKGKRKGIDRPAWHRYHLRT
jgi:hypothetical protein